MNGQDVGQPPSPTSFDADLKDRLIANVKKEVKQIMEEAVTRKFVHEESSSITSLCAAVECCLSHELKRRALGLFKTHSTTALLHKVAKNFQPAQLISKLVVDMENNDPNRRSSSSGESTLNRSKPQLHKHNSTAAAPPVQRYLWIRIALFEKQLVKIVDYLVRNSSKYYEKDALVSDPEYGSLLSSLLVGPCALDYSKLKTQDHFWSDPPADELVQRHRISSAYHSSTPQTPPTQKKLGLQFRKALGTGSSDEAARVIPPLAKDYVESLHQNNKVTLLYGKNNVKVQPMPDVGLLPGYLSLHQSIHGLCLKWTPNQLMNGCYESPPDRDQQDKSCMRRHVRRKSCILVNDDSPIRRNSDDFINDIYWEFALNVRVQDIVYLHCHQKADDGGTLVLVGQDGVQHPPIQFPPGGHLLALLSCLENGLLPRGQLDPPLWSQHGTGKVFPRLRRKGRLSSSGSVGSQSSIDEENPDSDYVFRIVTSGPQDGLVPAEYMDVSNPPAASQPPATPRHIGRERLTSSQDSSTSSTKSMSLQEQCFLLNGASSEESIQLLCDSMKRQIISRAFYGWLAHCRHLRTIRTHLSGLVNPTVSTPENVKKYCDGLTTKLWEELGCGEKVEDEVEIHRLVYYGGVDHEIRKQVWPYLLGYYRYGERLDTRAQHDDEMRTHYETTMSEWLAVEAIVRQRDKDQMAASLAKLSSESTSDGNSPAQPPNMSNEVFDDDDDESDSYPVIDPHPEPACNRRERDDRDTPTQMVSATSDSKDDIHTESTCGTPASARVMVTTPSVMSLTAQSEDGFQTADEGDDSSTPGPASQLLNQDSIQSPTTTTSEMLTVDAESRSASPASSQGGVYSNELIENYGLNLHRIDKDVQRCDRNYHYFTTSNLEKLRNIMCTYVWEHLETGYMQGMCDLVAPLLVVMDDEALTYVCFCQLMDRMAANFPHGGQMDNHFANMRSLIQILDSEMFELMHQNGDYTHFYFCYRWFLLDFKRELVYEDVFVVWECIWAAGQIISQHFPLFIALALVQYYRDIILDNSMDFTDIIRFFNEMAERHNVKAILNMARDLVHRLQILIENK